MINASLVEAFLEGATLNSLAGLLGRSPEAVERDLRTVLIELRAEAALPEIELTERPLAGKSLADNQPVAAREGSGASASPARHASALQRSPARRRAAADTADLSAYPESIRSSAAVSLRAAYDALRDGPKRVGAVAESTGLSSACAISALSGLRDKALAVKRDGWGGEWKLTEEVEV